MTDLNKMRIQLLDRINKKHGTNSVFTMDSKSNITDVKSLPTGSLALDEAIGVGGFPRGRIVEIYGPEAAGKSLLLLSTIAQTQKSGGSCAFIDVEHALSPNFARLLGVDTNALYYSQPDSGPKALEIMEELISSCLFDIVGLDSVAALVTEDEMSKGYNDHNIASTAIMMAKALKRMTAVISKTKTVAVFINQLREKPMTMYGNPEYTPGGKSLKFYSSLRVQVRKKNVEINEKGRQIAHAIKCRIIKNKVAPPFGECEIRLDYTKGIDRTHDVVMYAIETNYITKSSSWYHWKDKKWNGLQATLDFFTANPLHLDVVATDIRSEDHNEPRLKEKKEDTKDEDS